MKNLIISEKIKFSLGWCKEASGENEFSFTYASFQKFTCNQNLSIVESGNVCGVDVNRKFGKRGEFQAISALIKV